MLGTHASWTPASYVALADTGRQGRCCQPQNHASIYAGHHTAILGYFEALVTHVIVLLQLFVYSLYLPDSSSIHSITLAQSRLYDGGDYMHCFRRGVSWCFKLIYLVLYLLQTFWTTSEVGSALFDNVDTSENCAINLKCT
jgi:hypothetical protein